MQHMDLASDHSDPTNRDFMAQRAGSTDPSSGNSGIQHMVHAAAAASAAPFSFSFYVSILVAGIVGVVLCFAIVGWCLLSGDKNSLGGWHDLEKQPFGHEHHPTTDQSRSYNSIQQAGEHVQFQPARLMQPGPNGGHQADLQPVPSRFGNHGHANQSILMPSGVDVGQPELLKSHQQREAPVQSPPVLLGRTECLPSSHGKESPVLKQSPPGISAQSPPVPSCLTSVSMYSPKAQRDFGHPQGRGDDLLNAGPYWRHQGSPPVPTVFSGNPLAQSPAAMQFPQGHPQQHQASLTQSPQLLTIFPTPTIQDQLNHRSQGPFVPPTATFLDQSPAASAPPMARARDQSQATFVPPTRRVLR